MILALYSRLTAPETCAASGIMTTRGYQIVTKNETYFWSERVFTSNINGDYFVMPNPLHRLLSAEEANVFFALAESLTKSLKSATKNWKKL